MTKPPPLLPGVSRRLSDVGADADHRLLVAFSGGLDSSVLVDVLDRMRQRGGPTIELLHVDHGMRPDSGSDADFCARQARARGLLFHRRRLEWSDTSAGQTEARHRRLAAIADCALRRGIGYVAFGHHGDDRIETFLFHLRRGTGLDGLAAMRPRASFPVPGIDLCVLRPLIDHTRDELEAYARHRSIAHVVDPTNATDAYARNKIRHHLVPRLAEDSRRRRTVIDAIERLDDERRAADHYARQLSEAAHHPIAGLRAESFRRSTLAEAPRATVARLFLALEPTLDAEAVGRIHDAIESREHAPRHLTLSRCVITVVDDRVVFEPSEERGGRDVLQRRVHPVVLRPLSAGSAPFFGATLQWRRVDAPPTDAAGPEANRWEATFDASGLHTPLEVAGLRPGARLRRTDASGDVFHQKLTTLLSQSGVDADLRWRWPCVYDAGGQLLWAAALPRGAAGLPPCRGGPRWRISVTPSRELIEILHH